jgi:hypothetical protein
MASSNKDKKIGTYIFGSILLIFFICIYIFSPDKLPEYKQRMIAFSSSLLAGLFTYFFTGTIKLTGETVTNKFGKIIVQASSGIAVFILVLLWWLSSNSPIKIDELNSKLDSIETKVSNIKIQDITARITFHINNADETFPEIFRNTSQLELRICKNENLDTTKIKGWKNNFFLPNNSLNVTSTNQLFDRKVNQSVDLTFVELVRDYKSFDGNLEKFADPKIWEESSFEGIIRVVEKNKVLDSLRADSSKNDSHINFTDFANYYEMNESQIKELSDYDYRVTVYPITAKLEIFVNGVSKGYSTGIVVRVSEWDEDVRQICVIKFPVTKLNT